MQKLLLVLMLSTLLQAQNFGTPISLSDADEIRVGEVLAEQFAQEEGMKPTPQTERIDGYLQTVGDRVSAHAQRKLPYRFRFDPSPAFKSAFALPGGQVFVGGGVLAFKDSEDQLAAVLGHEVEHIALSQCRDRLVKVLSEQHLSVDQAEKLKVNSFLPGYGHENELAADREGVKLAIKAGYSPKAVIRLLQTFLTLGQQMPNKWSEAQQMLKERIAQIQSLGQGRLPASEKPLALP